MIAIIQRVKHARVHVNGTTTGAIQQGFLVLLGITHEDGEKELDWLSRKILKLRIFADEAGKMNRSIQDIDGEILLVSQFTLHANTKKGNRPSFVAAARPEHAEPLYEKMIERLNAGLNKAVQTGVFGAEMQVELCNDGPVTIPIDTEDYF